MAPIESFQKQNYEQWFISGDLMTTSGSLLEDGENIDLTNTTITAIDKDGNDATADVLQLATKALADSPDGGTNNGVKVRVQEGVEDLSGYKITFKIPTDQGNRFEIDIKQKIKEL